MSLIMPKIRFFEPDKVMIKWLSSYIGDRLPIDVGCGDGALLVELGMKKGIGIDPFMNISDAERLELMMDHRLHMMEMKIENCGQLIKDLGKDNKAIMIFARPCHSTFVEHGISLAPKGMEILYITKPSNLTTYNDLGKYDSLKKLVDHKGQGKDNEVVYSIIK